MSKKRYIDTKFWSDNYVTELDPLERYLFLYFISNEHTSLCGIYEIPLRVMAFETGLDVDMLKKILGRFERDNKIMYRDGWIAIKNFIKNQVKNPSVLEGIDRELTDVPSELKGYINTPSIQTDPTLTPDKLSKVKLSKVLSKEDEENFEKFWTEYPKKIAKKEAKKAFVKVCPIDETSLMTGLAKWKKSEQWTKDKGRFIPHPTTWLNQERWNDEVEIKTEINSKYAKYS